VADNSQEPRLVDLTADMSESSSEQPDDHDETVTTEDHEESDSNTEQSTRTEFGNPRLRLGDTASSSKRAKSSFSLANNGDQNYSVSSRGSSQSNSKKFSSTPRLAVLAVERAAKKTNAEASKRALHDDGKSKKSMNGVNKSAQQLREQSREESTPVPI
jgi:hypothetical protein